MKTSRHRHHAWALWLLLLLALLAVSGILGLCIGSTVIPLNKIIYFLLDTHGSVEHSILFDIRLPRIVLGLAVGGSLGLAGVILQGLFRNPLVEPYTLGISGGAALGVCFNIIFKFYKVLGIAAFPLSGFVGAILIVVIVYFLSLRRGIVKIHGVLLTGVMISFIASSLIMLMMALSRAQDLHGIVFWVMGSLDESNWFLIQLNLVISLVGLGVSYFFSVRLNALSIGEDEAHNLGIDTEKTKKQLFLLASLITGVSVSVAGIIGFIGLVVPHFIRMFISRDHRVLLVASYILGGAFLIFSDLLARTIIAPLELPVGVITGIIGGVLFIYALTKKQLGLGE